MARKPRCVAFCVCSSSVVDIVGVVTADVYGAWFYVCAHFSERGPYTVDGNDLVDIRLDSGLVFIVQVFSLLYFGGDSCRITLWSLGGSRCVRSCTLPSKSRWTSAIENRSALVEKARRKFCDGRT